MIAGHDFLASALTEHNPFLTTDQFFDWFENRKAAHRFKIEQIPFDKLVQWGFEPTTHSLAHSSGKFFKIEGIWVETNYGFTQRWSQPIINQPEIGILGIITKVVEGVPYLLMQAKMEPGNLNTIQLAPTLQATRSNFTQVHKGRVPPYLEYFTKSSRVKVLVDILQSEQGSRFLRKRNRNIIVEAMEEIPVLDDYCWLTIGQIHKIMRSDNVVNMDARTVISCIPYRARGASCSENLARAESLREGSSDSVQQGQNALGTFTHDVLQSYFDTSNSLHTNDEIISWFTQLKFRYDMNVECIPLKFVQDWVRTSDTISHVSGKFFTVIAVRVEADNREVQAWTQPLIKPCEEGMIAFVAKKINNVLHLLMQAKVEPGNFDVVEIAPTVQSLTGSYRSVPTKDRPPFLDYVLNARPDRIRYSARQSEEGGRFFQEGNLNLVIEAEDSFPVEVPDEYIWMTVGQIKEFIKYNNFVNVQARCLLSCLGLR